MKNKKGLIINSLLLFLSSATLIGFAIYVGILGHHFNYAMELCVYLPLISTVLYFAHKQQQYFVQSVKDRSVRKSESNRYQINTLFIILASLVCAALIIWIIF